MKIKMHDKVVTITNNYPLLSVDEIIHKNYVLFTFLDDITLSCDLRVRKPNMSIDACMMSLLSNKEE